MHLLKRVFCILILIFLLPSCLDKTVPSKEVISNEKPIDIESFSNENKDDGKIVKNNGQKSGLLLGISRESESDMFSSSNKYRTLWIYQSDGEIKVNLINDEIIAPCGDEFYSVSKHKCKYEKLNEWVREKKDFLDYLDYEYYFNFNKIVVRKLGQDTNTELSKEELKNKAEKEEWPINLLNEEILYIGNKYICIKGDNFITGGGTYKNQDYYINFFELNDTKKEVKFTDIIDEIPQDKINKLKEEKSKVLIEEKVENGELYYEEKQLVDDRYIAVRRENGTLVTQMPLITESKHYGNGSMHRIEKKYLNIEVNLPESIKNHEKLSLSWGNIKSYYPSVRDAVSSPSGNMLVILTDKKMLIFSGEDYDLNSPNYEITIDLKEKIIMNQWATGNYVKEWTKTIEEHINK
ncbi:hypothetical protein SH2C18_43110 [Clostridium sediminicola]|uniref:hypothetical protein n=1 Tax=Clostridium sediminicola TaxID=3114879 RepID=UPI0031F1F3A3